MEGTKACSKCGEVKPLSAFPRARSKKTGFQAYCLACHRKTNKAYVKSCIEKDLVKWKLKILLKDSKIRAKKAKLDHDLDLNYLLEILPTHCPYLGSQFHWEARTDCGLRGSHPFSPSIDRIDSSRGYVKGNVAIVSHRANSIKNDATEQELFRIGRAVSRLKAELAFPE